MKINKQTIMSYQNFNALSNDVIELAKEIMPDKVIYINFLNEKVQVTMRVSKNNTDVNVKEGITIPVDDAICNQIDYQSGKPLILENIRENQFNERVNKTIRDLNMGSYVGIPISFKNGVRFGTLCAAHHDKSHFDDKDVALLSSIAKLFSYYIELEQLAYKDPLTNLYNSQFLLSRKDEMIQNGGLAILLDLDHFKNVNDQFGHMVGDDILVEVGSKLTKFIEPYTDAYAFRLGGDEFIGVILTDSKDILKDKVVDIKAQLVEFNETKTYPFDIVTSIGYDLFSDDYQNFEHFINHIDQLMYDEKRKHKGA